MPILIVDDEPISRRLMGATLRKHNFEVVELGSAKEAVDFLQEHGTATMILSDVLMPDMDGFDMLRFLKADERFKRIPVILVTALSDTKSVLEGIELGAQDYVTKPISSAILVAKVEKILARQKARILVVDNEPAMRHAIVQIVKRVGFATLDVGSAEEALGLLKSNQFSAIIADSSLKGMTGIELLNAVKKDHPHLPVVLITGSNKSFSARELLLAGADGFITKPFHNIAIIKKLKTAMGQPV